MTSIWKKKTKKVIGTVKTAAALAALAVWTAGMASPVYAAGTDPDPAQQETPPDETESAGDSGAFGGLTTAGGTAVLIGAGAYTYVRKKWKEGRNTREEYVYYENHTRNGTLREEEKNTEI